MRLTTRIIHGQPETSRILLTSLLRRAGAVERRLGERGEEVHAEPDERYGGVGCGCVGVGGRGSHAKRWGRGQSSARAALCMKSDRRLAHLNDILAFAPLNAAGLSRCRAPAQWPHGCLSATSYALALAPRACPWHPHQTQRLDTGHRTAGPRGATRARARGSDLVKHADARPRAGQTSGIPGCDVLRCLHELRVTSRQGELFAAEPTGARPVQLRPIAAAYQR